MTSWCLLVRTLAWQQDSTCCDPSQAGAAGRLHTALTCWSPPSPQCLGPCTSLSEESSQLSGHTNWSSLRNHTNIVNVDKKSGFLFTCRLCWACPESASLPCSCLNREQPGMDVLVGAHNDDDEHDDKNDDAHVVCWSWWLMMVRVSIWWWWWSCPATSWWALGSTDWSGRWSSATLE